MKLLFTVFAKSMLIIIATYTCIVVVFYVAQSKFLFFPQPKTTDQLSWVTEKFPRSEEISINTPGHQLHGWILKSPTHEPAPILLYFGGNAEEVSGFLSELLDARPNVHIATFNYRGYGLSTGTPSEAHLFADALTIYDTITERSDIASSEIIVMGRSLGTGVAVYLASQRPVNRIILTSPYDSVANVAKRYYPWLPVDLLLRHRFDSLSRVTELDIPLLTIAADQDTTVPVAHSRTLFKAWNGPKELHILPEENHNSISSNPLYWQHIQDFLLSDSN